MANISNPNRFNYATYDWSEAQALLLSGTKPHNVASILDPEGTSISKSIIFNAIRLGYLKRFHFYNGVRHPFYDEPSSVVDIPTVTTDLIDNITFNGRADLHGTVVSGGAYAMSDRGFVWSLSPNPTLSDNVESEGASDIGSFSVLNVNFISGDIDLTYVKAYATNGAGTGYGNELTFTPQICLAEGTKVLLSDLTIKNIEDVEYTDSLYVWNFDEGKFDSSNPIWIKKKETTNVYNLLKFSDDTELKTISQHRIFNKEKGMFTYPMTNDTPIGTTTFNSDGNEVTLISKEIVHGNINFYNVITNNHMNLFANSILTSCRYNNIYPIENMLFVKDQRAIRPIEEFENIPSKYYDGLRLGEQRFELHKIEQYINRLERFQKEEISELV